MGRIFTCIEKGVMRVFFLTSGYVFPRERIAHTGSISRDGIPSAHSQYPTRVSDREYEHLAKFCEITERTQSDVIRELIRKLSIAGVLNPID